MTVSEWWDQVYPYAVELEKNITTSPAELSPQKVRAIVQDLPGILQNIQKLPHPDEAAPMREYLIRSVTYLIHAYQELKNDNTSEVEFYYSSALTQIAQLHYYLVEQGFTK